MLVGGKQYISFVDPKGLRLLDEGLSNPKIQFYRTIKEIEARLADPNVILNSYIVSPTPFQSLPAWGERISKSDLERCHVLFQQEDKANYIERLLTSITAAE